VKKPKLDYYISLISVNHYGKKRRREVTLGPLDSMDFTIERECPPVPAAAGEAIVMPSAYPGRKIKIEAIYGGVK